MFPCSGCGLCCQNISRIKELKDYDLGNGVCRFFNKITNECEIYDNRPNICKIDKMFDIKYHKYYTEEEFYIENANICNSLQNKYGIDKSFRVRIEKD